MTDVIDNDVYFIKGNLYILIHQIRDDGDTKELAVKKMNELAFRSLTKLLAKHHLNDDEYDKIRKYVMDYVNLLTKDIQ